MFLACPIFAKYRKKVLTILRLFDIIKRHLRLRCDFKKCGSSSFGRAPPCQGGGGGFEPRLPLHVCAASSVGRAPDS